MKVDTLLKLSGKYIFCFFLFVLTGWGVQAQTCTAIVGGTNFEASPEIGKWYDYYALNKTVQVGLLGNSISTPLTLASTSADFGTKAAYTIVKNPSILNEKYLDINEPMMAIAGVATSSDLLSYYVQGLKPGSDFTVTIEGYLLNSSVDAACGGVPGSTTNAPSLQILFDPQSNFGNTAYWAINIQKDQSIKSGLGGNKFTVTVTGKLPATLSEFTFLLKSGFSWSSCIALGFSKIEVRGCPDFTVVSNQGQEVCEGEQVLLSLGQRYTNASSYLWERSTTGTDGWTIIGNSEKVLTEIARNYYYRCTTDGAVSEMLHIRTVKCCEIAPGVGSSRKIIFHENFGTFNSATSYVDKDGFSMQATNWMVPGPAVPGTTATIFEFNEIISVGHSTMNPWKTGGLSSDASGDPKGGFLYLNPNMPFKGIIFDRTITGLCDDKKLFLEVSIANASYMNATTPPKVDLVVYSSAGMELGRVSSNLTITTYGWQKLKIDNIILPAGTSSVRIVVDSQGEGWMEGNDILMDELIVRVCAPPTANTYANLSILVQDTTLCVDEKVTIAMQDNLLLTNYYEGAANLRYLYQYSYNGTTWSNITGANSGIKSASSIVEPMDVYGQSDNTVVYFRMLVATESLLVPFLTNPNLLAANVCEDISISKPITVHIACPTCTVAESVAISAVGGTNLSAGESTTLTAAVSHPDYTNFTISWYKGDKTAAAIKSTLGMTGNLTVNYADVTTNGTKYYVKVADKSYENATSCWRFDSIIIKANPTSTSLCIVGGTNFDTDATLCDPTLANDATGWFSPTVATQLVTLCGTSAYYEETYKGKHIGLQTNTMSSGGTLFTPASWATILTNGNNVPNAFLGGSAIVANPKLIDPRLKEFHNNIFVNAGATHEKPFFSYTVTGLTPNSTVSFTADIYNLLDLESAAEYAKANNITTSFSIGGYNYDVYLKNYYGNNVSINGSATLNAMGGLNQGTSTGTITFGASTKLTITGTSDAAGTVTFYLGRPGGINFAPIGIDNVVVKGTIKPEIESQKVLPVCPNNPVTLYPKQTYPAGTVYSWSMNTTPVQTGSTESFTVIPPEQKDYVVTLNVAMPGCTPQTNTLELKTKKCCEAADGTPLASTYIFYDDFGTFPTDNTYEYRNPDGSISQGSVAGVFPYDNRPPIANKPNGFTSGITYWADSPNQHDRCAIMPWAPYGAMLYDNSQTRRGGMLYFGLSAASGYMNKVLYERTVCGLCPDKEITFGASYSAGNTLNSPDGVVGIEIQLLKGNPSNGTLITTPLARSGSTVLTKPEWRSFDGMFTADNTFLTENADKCVTLRVISTQDSYAGDNRGDLFLDDIYFSACTPPDVAVSSSLTGQDLLNLCTGTPLTLNAITSPSVLDYYGASTVRYLFQYTFNNPAITPNPVWKNLGNIQTSPSYTIADPGYDLNVFPDGNQMTYFRVVIGKEAQLNDPTELAMGAQSPCRNISISSIPVAASTNCQRCEKADKVTITPTGGILTGTGAIRTINLCEGESTTLTASATHSGGYDDYTITWHKGSKTSPAIGIASTSGLTAKPLTINYADVTAAGVKYYIKVADNLDLIAERCYSWDSIIVKWNPVPTVIKPADQVQCSGGDTHAVTFTSNMTTGVVYNWTNNNATIGLAANGVGHIASFRATNTTNVPITGTITVTPHVNGCVGFPATFDITVNPLPTVTKPADQVHCSGENTHIVTFTGTPAVGVVCNWTNNNSAIGLPASGTGNIAPFSASNTTNAQLAGTITVTPVANGCVGLPETFTITVNPVPVITLTSAAGTNAQQLRPETAIANITYALTGGATVTGLPSGVIYAVNAGTLTIAGTPTESGTFNYTVTTTGESASCIAATATGTITINDIPAAPSVGGYVNCPAKISENKTWLSLVDAFTGTLTWYDAATGGNKLTAEPPAFNTGAALEKTYWVTQTIDGCESERSEIRVSISAEPQTPIVNPYNECALVSGTKKEWSELVPTTGTLVWYGADNDASILSSPPPAFNTGTSMPEARYYVIVKDEQGCESKRALVTAQVKARPTAALSGDASICKGGSTNLTVTFIGTAPFIFTYSDGASNKMASASPITISPVVTTTYKLISLEDANCKADALTDLSGTSTVIVNDKPVVGTFSVVPICTGQDILQPDKPIVEWNGSVGTTKWEIGQGSSFSPIIFPYTVKDSDNGKTIRFVAENDCGQAIEAIAITVNPIPARPAVNRVAYLLSEAIDGTFSKNLLQQYPNAVVVDPMNLLVWYGENFNMLPGAPTPPAPPADTDLDFMYTYYVSQISPAGCESEKSEVKVFIYSVPSPVTSPLNYCVGETAEPLTAKITPRDGETAADYELRWYDTNSIRMSLAPTPSTNTAGVFTYYVSQYNVLTAAESSLVPLTVTVSNTGACSPNAGCNDIKALNYDPQATNMDDCKYADDENTFTGGTTETPVDIVGTKPVISCELTLDMPILSAIISGITFTGEQTIIAHWEIVQGEKTFNYDAEYSVSQSGITLFYLSIVCKTDLKSSTSVERGHTVSAVYDVDFGMTTGNICLWEEKSNNIMVYPNPFTEKLTVLVKGAKVTGIDLYSVEGNLLATYRSLNEVEIATSQLPTGVYVVKVTADGQTATVTAIKK